MAKLQAKSQRVRETEAVDSVGPPDCDYAYVRIT